MTDPTADDLLAICTANDVRLVRFLYCDNGGVVRGKVVPVEHLASRMASGVGLTKAMQAMNSLDQLQSVEGMGPVGEIRLVPDPSTFTVLPYAPRTAAMLVDHISLDGTPYPACPRGFLARMSARLAEHGIELRCAVENEFSLARLDGDRPVPIDTSLCFSTVGMTAGADVVDAIIDALDAQQIALNQYYPELGHGQHELSVLPRPALAAADTQVLVRGDDPRRRRAVRPGRLARPEAMARPSRQRRPRPLQRLAGRAQRVPRSGRPVRAVDARRAVRRRHPGPHARASWR